MSEILWQPDNRQVQQTGMFRFLKKVNQRHSLNLETYADLHRWSVEHATDFWEFYCRQSNIRFHRIGQEVLSSPVMPGARWFQGTELNFAENLIEGPAEQTAIFSKVEGKPITRLTYADLKENVQAFAVALTRMGIQPGDRIAGYLPNIPETVIAMLGTAAVGAIWSSCSPDFGASGVLDRFGQIEPKVLVCVDGYPYNGKSCSTLATVSEIARKVPSLRHIILIPFLNPSTETSAVAFVSVSLWQEKIDNARGVRFEFQSFPFNQPLTIMYSSGTTGLPKCIVHGAGGTLLQHHKEHALHTDIGAGDVVFYYTTCGWMMWNWLVSALAQNAAIVLYEGSPAYPSLDALWELIDEAGINVFGVSPKFLSINQNKKQVPAKIADLKTLRTVLSTGSPLAEESFRWVYENVKSDLCLSSICGGTDILSCFMLGNPMLPVRAGELQCVGLGMDVVALDEARQPVLNQKGELACRSPAPSMPLYFWKDPEGKKYFNAYFDKVPGMWLHGDFIEIKDYGGVIVYGRSDTTLNPGGVRIGTAEIYRTVENMPEVADSLVVGIEEDNDVRVILFVVPAGTNCLDESLIKKIKAEIRSNSTPRHVPHEIYQVRDIPRTLNGKKVELTVTKILQNEPVQNTGSLANPECLQEFEKIRSQRRAGKTH